MKYIRIFIALKNVHKMKKCIISQWINNEAILKKQVEELAANDKMAILKLKGENVLCSNQLEESHPAFLFLAKGKLSFKLMEII